ncbi:hypothetical protein N9V90_01605 [Endozoicomonas sp.]|nr:hypothetical protein [Endozoicomonas sp.]
MNYEDLPDRWKVQIKEHLPSRSINNREKLNAYDFNTHQVAKLIFEDDSYAQFKYRYIIEAPELKEVGVFTEHCGYHIFNMYGTHVCIEEAY